MEKIYTPEDAFNKLVTDGIPELQAALACEIWQNVKRPFDKSFLTRHIVRFKERVPS
jgi:hypothetical protein